MEIVPEHNVDFPEVLLESRNLSSTAGSILENYRAIEEQGKGLFILRESWNALCGDFGDIGLIIM